MSTESVPTPVPGNIHQRLVWVDLEMTGLDPEVNTIIEAAAIITDLSLSTLAEGPELVIQQSPQLFDTMDQWNQTQHTKSGLWQQVLKSTTSLADAEAQLLAFVAAHVKKGEGILAGNSIWQDRRFIMRYFPRLHAYLHYRMLDVSSFKIMFSHWCSDKVYKKKEAHRALEDIQESIAELRYYQQLMRFSREHA